MLIWLPPSEGKNAPACGPSLSLESLSRPCLTPDRRSVAEALVALGSGPEAAATLKVGARIDLSVNEALMSAPCAPASSLFTGVLFEAIEAVTPRAWESAGVDLPHLSRAQYSYGTHVPIGSMEAGDLIFWSSNGTQSGIYHVAIYLGGGQMIEAPTFGVPVRITGVDSRGSINPDPAGA